MKKIFFSILLLTSFLYAEENKLPAFNLDGEFDPSCYVCGTVNVITGALLQEEGDLFVDGPEPLSFIRYYSSAYIPYHIRFFDFDAHNHPSLLGDQLYPDGREPATIGVEDHYKYCRLGVQDAGGAFLHFFGKPHKSDKYQITLYLDPEMTANGLTNVRTGEISGRTNLKNSRVILESEKKYRWWTKAKKTYIQGDGTKRFFKEDNLLEKEIRPSGNRVFYSYDGANRIKKIWTTDPTEKVTFNWIDFNFNNANKTPAIPGKVENPNNI